MANFGCALCIHLYDQESGICSVKGCTINELERVCDRNMPVLDAAFRYKELLNSMIDYLLVGEKPTSVIDKLITIGFTKEELVNEFNFTESCVDCVIEDRSL